MSSEILKHRVRPNTSFTVVLESSLPFKIPVWESEIVETNPSLFELGKAEYEQAMDLWISEFASSLGLTSETGVVAADLLWQGTLAKLCNLTILQSDASSQIKLNSDFTGLFNNMLVIKSEAKADSLAIPSAISELIDKFHSTAHLMFPEHCPVIPGVASSRQLVSLHPIYYDSVSKRFCEDTVKQYRVLEKAERVRFIVDIFKITIWIVSQTAPKQFFHLVTNDRYLTRSMHYVTLQNDGLLKEFSKTSGRSIPIELIKAVYHAQLLNVEQGIANCSTVKIKTVGRRLRDAITWNILDKTVVVSQVEDAVLQLHSIGIAHCDVCVDNIFVNIIDNVWNTVSSCRIHPRRVFEEVTLKQGPRGN